MKFLVEFCLIFGMELHPSIRNMVPLYATQSPFVGLNVGGMGAFMNQFQIGKPGFVIAFLSQIFSLKELLI